jgi:hypothetical protein
VSSVHVVAIVGRGGGSNMLIGDGIGGRGARVEGDLTGLAPGPPVVVVGGDGITGAAGNNGGGARGFGSASGGGGPSDVRSAGGAMDAGRIMAGGPVRGEQVGFWLLGHRFGAPAARGRRMGFASSGS